MRAAALLIAGACVVAIPAHAQNPSAALGVQRAAASPLEWEIRGETVHPVLGGVRYATLKRPIETQVGNLKIYSRATLACQRGAQKLAIEVSNSTAPEELAGLKPASPPRLTCSRPIEPWDQKLVQEDLFANWTVISSGEAVTDGFRPFPLRECVSIRVEQEVALSPGYVQKTAKVVFDILPYNRQLDAIFVSCNDVSAYESSPPDTTVAAAPRPTASPAAPAPPKLASISKPEPAPVAKSQPPPIAKPEPAPVAKPQPPPVAKPEPVPVAKPEPVAIAKPEPVPAAKPAPAVVTGPDAASWKMARANFNGKTNVRAGPTLQSAIVTHLDPGAVVLVQPTGNDWWRAKPSKGSAWEGYIREDRLVFK